jgi:hypothetical protein
MPPTFTKCYGKFMESRQHVNIGFSGVSEFHCKRENVTDTKDD